MSIERLDTGERMSQAVIHGDTVYLAGQVGDPEASAGDQARQALARVDALLARCGSARGQILQATLWLADMEADFAAVNAAWDDWVPAGAAPARAAGEARLALPGLRVEVIVVAARGATS
ncbi:MAG: RidA family protein [Halofilum sp. (in: g-proteobacteria)]|nr:RidA family protein [Halofilum sp. (in: g-proteobacteria)]